MTTIIISRYAILLSWFTEELGVTPAESVETLDEFAAKYLMTLWLRMIWADDPSRLAELRENDPALDACCNAWEGGGTIEDGHVRLWP